MNSGNETTMHKYKRTAALIISIIMSLYLIWLLHGALRPPVLPLGASMPVLAFTSPAGPDSLRPSPTRTTLIMLFSRHCPHCLYELNLFEKHIDELDGALIYLTTTDRDFIPGFDNLQWPALSRTENFIWVRLDEKQFTPFRRSDRAVFLHL